MSTLFRILILHLVISCAPQDFQKDQKKITKTLSSRNGTSWDITLFYSLDDSVIYDHESFGVLTFVRDDDVFNIVSPDINGGSGTYLPPIPGLGEIHPEVTFNWWMETYSSESDLESAEISLDFVSPDADFNGQQGWDDDTSNAITRLIGGITRLPILREDKKKLFIHEAYTAHGDPIRNLQDETTEVEFIITFTKQ